MKVIYAGDFDCSPDILWTWLSEPSKQMQWMLNLQSVEPDSEGKVGVGWVAKFKFRDFDSVEVDEYAARVAIYDQPRHFVLVVTGKRFGDTSATIDYRLTEMGGRTRIEYIRSANFPVTDFFERLMMSADYRLIETDDQTRPERIYSLNHPLKGFFLNLMIKLAAWNVRMQLRTEMGTLRRLAEAEAWAAVAN
jgi:hypothetical protein